MEKKGEASVNSNLDKVASNPLEGLCTQYRTYKRIHEAQWKVFLREVREQT